MRGSSRTQTSLATPDEVVSEYGRSMDRMYFTFKPRPDQPDRFDEQESFYYSKHRGVTFLLGGNGSGTTTTTLAKAVKFLLRDQPPPRPATPFWFVSEGYPMVMDVVWNEKLCSRGLLPKEEIQWDKIDWYKPTQNWPFRVPLKPWPGENPDNYWMLEFKSYEQGRSKMAASSIGGFVFVEQCPFELITETLRGCRDYNYAGAKIAEFTPIDPVLSRPLEDMLQNNRLPDDWAVYRCNTECAMQAGHVSRDWYNEFFGMVSDEMRDVRKIGAFASYEGLIYPKFSQRLHTDADVFGMLVPGVYHYRAIDWGSGPDNAMVCLWGAKDAAGNWYIYDEYYSTDQSMNYVDHAEEIKERHAWNDHMYHRQTYADPSSPGLCRLFTDNGIPVSAAINSVLEGIEAVRVQLTLRHGEPQIIIDSDRCPNLVRELQTYRWERARNSRLNPKDAAPRPLKKDDHCVDALRYLVFTNQQSGRFDGMKGKRVLPKNRKRFIHRSGDEEGDRPDGGSKHLFGRNS